MNQELIIVINRSLDFLGMVASLWLAFYIVARGSTNRLTFRVFVLLTTVSFYFAVVYLNNVAPFPMNGPFRSMAIMLGLTAGQNLSFYLLPEDLKKTNIWVARGFIALGIVSAITLLGSTQMVTSGRSGGNLYAQIPNLYKFAATCGILYNIRLIYKTGYLAQNRSFYIALVFGASTILYGSLEVVVKIFWPEIVFPRFVSTALFFCFLGLLGYSVAHHQALLEQRVGPRDFILSAITIIFLGSVYLIPGTQIGLSPVLYILLAVIVITTHAAIDFLRENLNRQFHEGERKSRREIGQLVTATSDEETFRSNLRRGLAIACLNLQATSGYIAVKLKGEYQVLAFLHSYPVNMKLPGSLSEIEELTNETGKLKDKTDWLAPAYGTHQQVAVIGIGPRRGLKGYIEGDLFWLEDIADAIGDLVWKYLQRENKPGAETANFSEKVEVKSEEKPDDFLPKFAVNPDRQLIKQVEFGLKNLHDYIILGRSPLADQVGINGENHIEKGKDLHQTLVNLVKTLRPPGNRPGEPLPRTWHNYVILNDAYVEDVPDQEIMARLYISETTYYRTRRKAVRGVTRALLESGIVQ